MHTLLARSSLPVRAGGRLDLFGALASAACAVHCLAIPLLLIASIGPLAWVESLHGAAFDRAFAVFAIAFGAGVIGSGYRHHGRRHVLGLYGLAVILLLAGAFGAHSHDADPSVTGAGGQALGHALWLAAGGFLMAAAHWRSRALRRAEGYPGATRAGLAR
jgi:hypothetical protein